MMSSNEQRSKLGPLTLETFYMLLVVFLYLCWRIFQLSLLGNIAAGTPDTVIHFVLLGALVLGDLCFNHTYKQDSLFALALFVLAIAVKVCSDSTTLIDLVILVWCCRNVPFKYIAAISIVSILFTSILLFLFSQFGLILDYVWDPGTRNRHGFGFLYCTTLSHLYLNITLLWIYLRRSELRAIEYLIILVFDILIYAYTDSRNSFLLVIVSLLLCLLLKRKMNASTIRRAGSVFAAWIFPICALISLIASIFYDPTNQIWQQINGLLSNRLAQTHATLFHYGVLPFGQDLPLIGHSITYDGVLESSTGTFDSNFVDNSYMSIMVNLGWVTWIVIVLLFFFLGRKAALQGDKYLVLILFMIAIHALLDPQLIEPIFNTFVFLFPTLAIKNSQSCNCDQPLLTSFWFKKR